MMPNEDGGEGQIKEPIYDPESGDTGTGPMGWVIATYLAPDRIENGPLNPGDRSEVTAVVLTSEGSGVYVWPY